MPAAWSKRRLQIPRNLILHFADLREDEREWKGPVQVTKPLRTVVDCSLDAVAPDLVAQAVREGIRRRLFTRQRLTQTLRQQERARQNGAA